VYITKMETDGTFHSRPANQCRDVRLSSRASDHSRLWDQKLISLMYAEPGTDIGVCQVLI
jgi:hypothetical protein